MKEYKKEEQFVDIEFKRTCNKCGTIFDTEKDSYETWQWESMREMLITFGYGDNDDGVTFKFDLCNKCLHEWIDSFKIKPEISLWNELL